MGYPCPLPVRAAVKTRTTAGDMDALRTLLSQYLAEEPAKDAPVPQRSAPLAQDPEPRQSRPSRSTKLVPGEVAPALDPASAPAVPDPSTAPASPPIGSTPEAGQALLVTEDAPPPAGPAGSIRIIENAAARIRDYEQRFRDIEIDARAFVARIDEEQERLMAYVATLETEVDAAEDRGRRAETALDEARLQAWEERLMRRHAETRAADAEAEAEKCQTYLRRVYDVLERMNLLDGLEIKRPD